MQIRKATASDVIAIAAIYDAIHTGEEAGELTTGWQRSIYPTAQTALNAIDARDMYVLEAEGEIVASARINQEQVDAYAQAGWTADAPADRVLVLHTLAVKPSAFRKGYASAFVKFYEELALKMGCPNLRMDTNAVNLRARSLYRKLGYAEVGIVSCAFNGIPGVRLVCLEKTLPCPVTAYVVSAFSKDGCGGNKAGIVLDCGDLTRERKLAIAGRLGYSETVFLFESDKADYRLEYFTPVEEVPLCGHATIAAFSLLRLRNALDRQNYTIETGAGILRIQIGEDGTVFMEQNCPEYLDCLSAEEAAMCVPGDCILGALPIQIVSTGLRDILLPVKSKTHLAQMNPDFSAMSRLSCRRNAVGMHAFCLVDDPEITAVCRNFAPLYGIDEESATGTANCALACYLFRYAAKKDIYVFEQGHSLNSVSRIVVKLQHREDRIDSVFVGGSGYLVEAIFGI